MIVTISYVGGKNSDNGVVVMIIIIMIITNIVIVKCEKCIFKKIKN